MVMHFEDALRGLAASGAGRACLILVGTTTTKDGEQLRLYDWSEGAVAVAVGPGRAELKRVYGHQVGNNRLVVTAADLRGLKAAVSDFSTRGAELAQFYSIGQPYLLRRYYRPQGKGSKGVVIGERRGVNWRFGAPSGTQEVVDLEERLPVADGVAVVGEVWVRGEPKGPPEGSLVGYRYQVGDISVDCDHNCAFAYRGDDAISLGYDTVFIDALLEVLDGD